MREDWQKQIIRYLVSQTITLFGSSIVQYAILWYITLETKSGIMMTISILAGFLPTFILSPFAGVWADRYNRKKLIMLADGGIALATLLLAILFSMGYQSVWLLFLVSSIRAVGTAIQMPSASAVLPQLVPEDQLFRINGINSSIQSVTMLISPMISGALMSIVPLFGMFLIDVVTAIIGITTLAFFVKVPDIHRDKSKDEIPYWEDLKSGFAYIKSHPYVMTFFGFMGAMLFLAATPAFLTPLQVTRSFGSDVWRLTAIEIAFSLGMTLGGILMASWGGFKNRVRTMSFAIMLMGTFTLALGFNQPFFLYLIWMGIIGISMPIYNTPAIVLLQEKVEEQYLGRVFGVLTMITSSMMPLGMVIFGPLADFVKIEWLLMGTGALTLLEGILLGRNKTLLEAGKHIKKEEA